MHVPAGGQGGHGGQFAWVDVAVDVAAASSAIAATCDKITLPQKKSETHRIIRRLLIEYLCDTSSSREWWRRHSSWTVVSPARAEPKSPRDQSPLPGPTPDAATATRGSRPTRGPRGRDAAQGPRAPKRAANLRQKRPIRQGRSTSSRAQSAKNCAVCAIHGVLRSCRLSETFKPLVASHSRLTRPQIKNRPQRPPVIFFDRSSRTCRRHTFASARS
jgi:hypothetical protein